MLRRRTSQKITGVRASELCFTKTERERFLPLSHYKAQLCMGMEKHIFAGISSNTIVTVIPYFSVGSHFNASNGPQLLEKGFLSAWKKDGY